MKLTSHQAGVWKGALATALLFTTGIGAGLVFLKRKHEDELDEVERDTARNCLDFAANHYEGVIRRKQREAVKDVESKSAPSPMTQYYEEFLEFQRRLDNAGKREPTEEEVEEMRFEMARNKKAFEEQQRELAMQEARLDREFDRIKLKLLAKKAAELADKASSSESQTPDIHSEEFKREIDAMNNYEEPEV